MGKYRRKIDKSWKEIEVPEEPIEVKSLFQKLALIKMLK